MVEALKLSINTHSRRLVDHLVGVFGVSEASLPFTIPQRRQKEWVMYLAKLSSAARLTNGAAMFPQLTDRFETAADLTRLGLAAIAEIEDPSSAFYPMLYSVSERFAVESIDEFLQGKRGDGKPHAFWGGEDSLIRRLAGEADVAHLRNMLEDVLRTFGRGAQFKGNIVERAVLERLVAIAREHSRRGRGYSEVHLRCLKVSKAERRAMRLQCLSSDMRGVC